MTEWEELRARLPSPITRADAGKVVRAVLSEKNPWDSFARARVPFPFAVSILRALVDCHYLEFEPTHLTVGGNRLAEELDVRPGPDFTCPTCEGSGTVGRGLEEVYDRYLQVFHSRPRDEDANLDQGAMTPDSLFRRLALVIQEGDAAGREIVVLGDDDLASVALALTRLPSRVTVLEIDPRICEYIHRVAQENQLGIRVVRQDLAGALPADLLGSAQTFICDPPETEAGLLLFVEKGLAMLGPGDGNAGYFGVTVLEASASKWSRWQKRLLEKHPVAFTHILPPFTRYESWPDEQPLAGLGPLSRLSPTPWYRFAFYRLETLPSFHPAPDFKMEHSEAFYFDEESDYEAFKGSQGLAGEEEKGEGENKIDN